MAKSITQASIVTKHAGSTRTNYAHVVIECPVSELAALLALAGLTNAVPAAVTNRMVAIGDTGPAQ